MLMCELNKNITDMIEQVLSKIQYNCVRSRDLYLLAIDDVSNVAPEKEQYLKIAFYLIIADVSVRN